MFVKMVGTRYEVLRSLLNNSNIMKHLNAYVLDMYQILLDMYQITYYCGDQEVGAWEMTNEND